MDGNVRDVVTSKILIDDNNQEAVSDDIGGQLSNYDSDDKE